MFIQTAANNPEKVQRIFCANAGDSRSVASSAGKAIELSNDHKPTLDSERQRIENAGGYVSWGRVNGNLALSRAIGDFEFKRTFELPVEQQIVTAFPEVETEDMNDDKLEFVVLACDGIWDCLSSQDVVDIVRRSVANGKELKDICEDLMERCLAPDSDTGGIGCDNMTVCIVALLNGKTKEEWYSFVKNNITKYESEHSTPSEIAPVFKNAPQSTRAQDGSGQDGTVSIQSLLSGGLARGEDDDDQAGGSLRLPGGLAGALSGAGIVFRPGGRSDGGEVVYEAHVVDEEDSGDSEASDQDGGNASSKATSAAGSTGAQQDPKLVASPEHDAKAASSTNQSDKMEVDEPSKPSSA